MRKYDLSKELERGKTKAQPKTDVKETVEKESRHRWVWILAVLVILSLHALRTQREQQTLENPIEELAKQLENVTVQEDMPSDIQCGPYYQYHNNQILKEIVQNLTREYGQAETIYGPITCNETNVWLFPLSYNISRTTGLNFTLLAQIEWHEGELGLINTIEQTDLSTEIKNNTINTIYTWED